MWGFIKKSFPLIIINMAMSLLLTLGLSNVVSAYIMSGNTPDGLSNDFFSFHVLWGNEDTSNLQELIKAIDSVGTPYQLYKTSPNNVNGITCRDSLPALNIVDGRNFSAEDFVMNRNVALVSTEMRNNCATVNGVKYCSYANSMYEVIGVYKRTDNFVHEDSLALYNLQSSNVLTRDDYIRGSYNLDIDGDNWEASNMIKNVCSFEITRSPTASTTFRYRLSEATKSQGTSITIVAIIVLMMFLNSADSTLNWLESRQKETFIRKICGATWKSVYYKTLFDYLVIVIGSFVFGAIGAYFFSSFVKLPLGDVTGINGFMLALIFVFVVIVGYATISISFALYRKKHLLEVGRW